MADQPYIKWWTSDFLTGVIDLSAEETGVYAIILTMMADRGAPVPCGDQQDRQWLARRCNLTTRAFNRALARLIDLGKLEERDGLLGNRRMLAEIRDRDKKSNQARDAAHARWEKWEAEHPLSLPFDANGENTGKKAPVKQAEKPKLNAPKKKPEPRNSAIPAERTHVSPSRRARARPEPESESIPTHPTTEPRERPGSGRGEDENDQGEGDAQPDRLARSDLWTLYEAVAEASGHNPVVPGQIDRAFSFVEEWHRLGISFDDVVIPTIKSMIAKTDDPTRTLGRFDAAIKHQHARQAATPKGSAYTAPASPIMEVEGEDERFKPVRAELLKALGPSSYCSFLNRVRLEATEKVDGTEVMQVLDDGGGWATRLKDAHRQGLLGAVAKRHGFVDVW